MSNEIAARFKQLPWPQLEQSLHQWGYAKTSPLLTPAECKDVIQMYADDSMFRSRIDMQRYRFGIGEYKYFADPLPQLIQEMRTTAYHHLASIANLWMEQMGLEARYPADLQSFLKICDRHQQTRPTPLMLRYWEGCYNCLHQDIYGDIAFPLQLTVALSSSKDYQGGEFLLMEQRPRAQSRGEAISLEQGEAIIFANRYKPVASARGFYRANVRHGVSRLLEGSRYTLGIIFHNAK